MKSQFIADLADGQSVSSSFLVREKEVRTSAKSGKSWLHLDLMDRTGLIAGKMWDNFAPILSTFDRNDVVQIRARVKIYNGQKELNLEQIVPVAERDYDMGDFVPHTKCDVEKLCAGLSAAVGAMKNPWLKKLLESVIHDPEIAVSLKRAPAAMTMHHAYLGGLLEHMMSLIGLSSGVCASYPELDPDLVLTGIVLHDIGKIHELRYARGIDYSTEGRLLGHITIGAILVHEKIKAIPGFPAPLGVLVEHLILSHHGSLELASFSPPQTREAIALHFMDDLDSKMAAMRATLESEEYGEAEWTSRNPALRRALLRPDRFLAGDSGPETGNGSPAGVKSPPVIPRKP